MCVECCTATKNTGGLHVLESSQISATLLQQSKQGAQVGPLATAGPSSAIYSVPDLSGRPVSDADLDTDKDASVDSNTDKSSVGDSRSEGNNSTSTSTSTSSTDNFTEKATSSQPADYPSDPLFRPPSDVSSIRSESSTAYFFRSSSSGSGSRYSSWPSRGSSFSSGPERQVDSSSSPLMDIRKAQRPYFAMRAVPRIFYPGPVVAGVSPGTSNTNSSNESSTSTAGRFVSESSGSPETGPSLDLWNLNPNSEQPAMIIEEKQEWKMDTDLRNQQLMSFRSEVVSTLQSMQRFQLETMQSMAENNSQFLKSFETRLSFLLKTSQTSPEPTSKPTPSDVPRYSRIFSRDAVPGND